MPANYMFVGAIHLRGGFHSFERSETFPGPFGSLPAFCRTLYRIPSCYMGLWY